MLRVVRIVSPGRKYGKTSVAEEILRILRDSGVSVAAVKHAHSTPKLVGDGGRMFRAGARHVAVLADDGTLIQYTRAGGCCRLDKRLAEAVVNSLKKSFDAVVIEGFKRLPLGPAILIVKSADEVRQAVEGVAGPVAAVACPREALAEVVAEVREALPEADVISVENVAEYVASLILSGGRNPSETST